MLAALSLNICGFLSHKFTVKPHCANSWAMPLPIAPAPNTAIVLKFMSRIELLCEEKLSFPSITEPLEVGKGKDVRLLDETGPVAYYMQPV